MVQYKCSEVGAQRVLFWTIAELFHKIIFDPNQLSMLRPSRGRIVLLTGLRGYSRGGGFLNRTPQLVVYTGDGICPHRRRVPGKFIISLKIFQKVCKSASRSLKLRHATLYLVLMTTPSSF